LVLRVPREVFEIPVELFILLPKIFIQAFIRGRKFLELFGFGSP